MLAYIIVAVIAAALLWPGSPAGKAVVSVTGSLHSVLKSGSGLVTG